MSVKCCICKINDVEDEFIEIEIDESRCRECYIKHCKRQMLKHLESFTYYQCEIKRLEVNADVENTTDFDF